jgi:hypothetical protein
MNRSWTAPVTLLGLAVLLAGCRPGAAPAGGKSVTERLLVDQAAQLSFRNHVKTVPDPAGGPGTVLAADRVSRGDHQMVFNQEAGFFVVPEDYRGAVRLRVLVRAERRLRVALVAAGRIRSYYLDVPEEGRWCDLELPLRNLEGKIAPGQTIDDITIWLKCAEGQKELRPGSALYLDRITFRPE